MLGTNAAEVALTRHLAKTLVQKEVMEPMNVGGWQQGIPPSEAQAAMAIAKRAADDGASAEDVAAFLNERGIKMTLKPGGQPELPKGAPVATPTPAPVTSGQPATPVTPAPVVATKTDAPTGSEAAANLLATFESLKDANGLYMGKYKTVDEALRGAGHLANMAKSALRRAEEADARLAALPAQPVAAPPVTAPVTAPAKPFSPPSHAALELAKARLDKVLSKVNESGFDGDSAREYADATSEVARETARAVAEDAKAREQYERDAETARWTAVNTYMAEKYPESQHVNDEEFTLFLKLNPLVTDAMQYHRSNGRETRAAELGYTEFIKARGSLPIAPGDTSRADAVRVEADLAAREEVRKELRDQALKDAGIVHGSAGGNGSVEAPGVTGPSQEEIDAAAARMRREGETPGSQSAAEWRHHVIGRFLPQEIFGR